MPQLITIVDGLAYGALPADLIKGVRAPIVALVHHPLCLEAGLSEARREQLRALENGHGIAIDATEDPTIGVDTAEDAVKFEQWLA